MDSLDPYLPLNGKDVRQFIHVTDSCAWILKVMTNDEMKRQSDAN